jgi:hypothetical protein
MAAAAYRTWNEHLFGQPDWSKAPHMTRVKFYRMIESALDAAVADRKAAA